MTTRDAYTFYLSDVTVDN